MSIRERLRAVGASTGSAGVWPVRECGRLGVASAGVASAGAARAPTSAIGGTELYCAQLWPRRIKAPVWAAGP